MDIQWLISADDVTRVKVLVESQSNNALVRSRQERNLATAKPEVTRESFWRAMVSMRLTTRQKSGPDSHVARFIRRNPFSLTYEAIHRAQRAEDFIANTLKAAGGIRFSDKIANELAHNFGILEEGEWASTLEQCNRLTSLVSREVEIDVANYVQDRFLGFGPKQARNLLQSLGLTRHEIPIDSRVTDWLNDFGFPVRLSAAALSDSNYYRFVSDGIQVLCEKCGVVPCIFDAAVFTIRDSNDWTEENVIY